MKPSEIIELHQKTIDAVLKANELERQLAELTAEEIVQAFKTEQETSMVESFKRYVELRDTLDQINKKKQDEIRVKLKSDFVLVPKEIFYLVVFVLLLFIAQLFYDILFK